MSELDDAQAILAIEASLASFTKLFDDDAANRFNELRKCSFFNPIPTDWLKLISEQAEISTFQAGDFLTTEGDGMNAFYVILFGSTTVYCNHKAVGTIVSGECVGEGTFFDNGHIARSATVVADGQVIAAQIDKLGIDRLQSEAKAYMDKALLLALFQKLQGANRKIQSLSDRIEQLSVRI